MASVKEFSVEEKLTSLVRLQKIDSKLDEIQILKGELPMEVNVGGRLRERGGIGQGKRWVAAGAGKYGMQAKDGREDGSVSHSFPL